MSEEPNDSDLQISKLRDQIEQLRDNERKLVAQVRYWQGKDDQSKLLIDILGKLNDGRTKPSNKGEKLYTFSEVASVLKKQVETVQLRNNDAAFTAGVKVGEDTVLQMNADYLDPLVAILVRQSEIIGYIDGAATQLGWKLADDKATALKDILQKLAKDLADTLDDLDIAHRALRYAFLGEAGLSMSFIDNSEAFRRRDALADYLAGIDPVGKKLRQIVAERGGIKSQLLDWSVLRHTRQGTKRDHTTLIDDVIISLLDENLNPPGSVGDLAIAVHKHFKDLRQKAKGASNLPDDEKGALETLNNADDNKNLRGYIEGRLRHIRNQRDGTLAEN